MTGKRKFNVAPVTLGNDASLESFSTSFFQLRQIFHSQARLDLSSGPWLATDDHQVLFDASGANFGLGYNAGSLFGVTQFPSVWNSHWSDESLKGLQQATADFVDRKPQWRVFFENAGTPTERIRAYIAAQILDQFQETIIELRPTFLTILETLLRQNWSPHSKELLRAVDVQGQCLRIDFTSSGSELVSRLLSRGVLPQQWEEQHLILQLPLSSSQSDLQFLAEQLVASWYANPVTIHQVSVPDRAHYYRFNAYLLSEKSNAARGISSAVCSDLSILASFLSPEIRSDAQLVMLNRDSWGVYREQVERLQQTVYEPARQTSLATFDSLFRDDYGFGILVDVDGEVAGMACAGPIVLFPNERGTLDDPNRLDRHILYPLDLTVTPNYQGALGTFLKRALVLLAVAKGHRAIHGRNRDRLAGAMWAINLSLGSYQLRHLKDDYPDSHPHRDCIYYRCPLRWPESHEHEFVDAKFWDVTLMSRLVNASVDFNHA
jgi:hypothetical protein